MAEDIPQGIAESHALRWEDKDFNDEGTDNETDPTHSDGRCRRRLPALRHGRYGPDGADLLELAPGRQGLLPGRHQEIPGQGARDHGEVRDLRAGELSDHPVHGARGGPRSGRDPGSCLRQPRDHRDSRLPARPRQAERAGAGELPGSGARGRDPALRRQGLCGSLRHAGAARRLQQEDLQG